VVLDKSLGRSWKHWTHPSSCARDASTLGGRVIESATVPIYRIWTGICVAVVVVAFFATPAWDTDTSTTFLPGQAIFAVIATLDLMAWLVGLLLVAVVRAIRRRRRSDSG
jgi:uncharacterized integral membrane protein